VTKREESPESTSCAEDLQPLTVESGAVIRSKMVMGVERILASLCDALVTENGEQALARGLSILADSGIVIQGPGCGETWLSIESAGRSLSLALSVPPCEAPDRALVGCFLRAALARAVAEEHARSTRERLEMLSQASFEGILIHADGVVIDVNHRFEAMMGCDRAEVVGRNTTERFVAAEDLEGVLAKMGSGYEGAYVITGVRWDGSRFRAELQSKQGRLGERPVRVVAIRDVTERERLHALLAESEVRLRDLAAGAFDGIVYGRNGIVVDVAGPIREKLGVNPDDLKGKAVVDLVAQSSRATIARFTQEGRVGSLEADILANDGAPVPVEVVVVNSTLHGAPVRIAGLRDLREKRRLERERANLLQQIERSQRTESLGILAGGIAHDFNNLLVGVLGNAELLLDRITDPLERQAALAIRSAGERAATLTAQMLAYAGRRDLGRREAVDLGGLCRDLRELLDAVLSKKARIELAIGPETWVFGNRATLTQVLMNLLTNASDALGDQPGVIRVTMRRTRDVDARFHRALGASAEPGNWVLTDVSDTGAGMDAGTKERIFEPFFSTKEKGHGLGLAACLGIVTSHGGALVVDSEIGRGSCFSMILPGAKASTEAPADPRPAAHARPIRVLVVDDEPLVRSLVRRLLERRGYSVEEAADGRACLAALERAAFDVVLLDVTMPDIDGAEVVRRLRAAGSNIPVVLSSGYMAVSAENALDRSMIQAFLPKPFTPTDLVEALERALAAPK